MASACIKALFAGCSDSRLDQSQVRDLRRAIDPDRHPGDSYATTDEQVRGFLSAVARRRKPEKPVSIRRQ
jgi:hypothetical protein